MSEDFLSIDFKKKGWTKEKLKDIARQHDIDVSTANTFPRVRALLVSSQKRLLNADNQSDISVAQPVRDRRDGEPYAQACVGEPSTHGSDSSDRLSASSRDSDNDSENDGDGAVNTEMDSFQQPIPVSHTPLLPSVDISSNETGREADGLSSTSLLNTAPTQPLNERHSNKSGTPSSTLIRAVRVKSAVHEECKSMCDNIGIPNSDMVSLNFLCERSLPPDCHDRNDDDQSKATSAASRAMAVLGGEPYFPQDVDVMNRMLTVTHQGEYILCEHADFPIISAESSDSTHSASANNVALKVDSEDPEIRVLWIKVPIYQSRFSPFRSEMIEFAVDANTSKMMMDVDRTIRSLITAHNANGLSKRNDKMNSFYLLTRQGDVMLLNSGLLKRCPLKRQRHNHQRNKNNDSPEDEWTEPLFLCLHDAVPGESPRPAQLRNREWKYVFPHVEVAKVVYLLVLWWLMSLWRGTENSLQSSVLNRIPVITQDTLSRLYYLIDLIFSSPVTAANNRGVSLMVSAVELLRSNRVASMVSSLMNSGLRALVSPVLAWVGRDASGVDFAYAMYYVVVGYGLLLLMRLRAKFCPFNLFWLVINRYWYVLAETSVFGWIRRVFKPGRGRSVQPHDSSNDKTTIRVRYEERYITRFLIMHWFPTGNFDEDYDVWSSTLRAALGITTSSQNDPDMMLSDPSTSGRRIALSASFLKHKLYANMPVFRVCKPGMVSRGFDTYFNIKYFFVAALCWMWMEVIKPFNAGNLRVTEFSAPLVINFLIDSLWRNTLSSLLVDVANIERAHWPAFGGHRYGVPALFAVMVGILAW